MLLRQVLPKIQLIYGKTPAPASQLKTLFKKKFHHRRLPSESTETSKNAPWIEHLQRQRSTIIKTNNILCSIKRSAASAKGNHWHFPILAFQAINFWNQVLHWIEKLFSSIFRSERQTFCISEYAKWTLEIPFSHILVCFH